MQAGQTIRLARASYVLREPLGGSSYGLVWRADGPQQQVALKLVNRVQMERALPAQRACWTDSARREIDFLRALSPWDGRHIVRLLDCGEHEGLPALALERLDTDLARHLQAERAAGRIIPFGQVLAWMTQVNQALAKVHQYGWRYLDLKPANLLLDAARRSLRLADFGTNRALADARPHAYAGTASWQAPEQFFPCAGDAYATDARADYFSLGALFYFLVTSGATLSYCEACGDAYRQHGTAGAQRLRERLGGALPPTLTEAEAALFAQRIAAQTDARGDGGGAPALALSLLRALVHPQPGARPSHALQISRVLGKLSTAWQWHGTHTPIPMEA